MNAAFCRTLLALMAVVAVTGCAEVPEDPEARAEFRELNDPLEPMNRAIFTFNTTLDRWTLKPVAKGYRAAIPKPVRDRIHDFLHNMNGPYTFANDVLQGSPDRAAQTMIRFMINTTAGLGGMFDVVGSTGGPRYHEEDFGQTLAVWGAGEGPYLMLPFFGPSNPRDAVGRGVGMVADPTDIAIGIASTAATYGRMGGDLLDTRTVLLDPLDDLEKSSLDFYAAVRSLYRQRRISDINNKDRPLSELSGQ
jgi:phospholipid-binding lipoprotein MlaA